MAVVTQGVTPTRFYSPFEGMSEAQRLVTSVPRGLVRFHSDAALSAKPVNDSIDLTITCSFPNGFAYVLSALSFELQVDTATDWDVRARGTVFNGLPNVAPGNNQPAIFEMANVPSTAAGDPRRILAYGAGALRDWFSGVIVKSPQAVGHSFILQYHNSAAAVQAAGTMSFNLTCYQYELNQAVRFPLNWPFPVGPR